MNVYLSKPGVVCSCGFSLDELYDSVVQGNQHGIKKVTAIDGEEYYAARIDDSKLKETDFKFKTHFYRIIDAALVQIENDVKKAVEKYGKNRVAVCAGSCDNGSELSVPSVQHYLSEGKFGKEFELSMLGIDVASNYIKDYFDLKGPAASFATACSSSSSAMVKAAQLIKSGFCDAVIAGGADLASDTVLMGFSALSAVSEEITNPFSKNRHGITIGEAAVFFVMTRDPLDENEICLLGYGESCDAYHLTSPDPSGDGAYRAMQEALTKSGLKAEDIEYINLHGTGTKFNDSMEAKSVSSIFGMVPCSTTKSVTGHTLGAAGALEAAVCWKTLAEGKLPVQVWDGVRDEELPELNFVTKENQNKRIKICMSNSYAFGGANTSLILEKKMSETTPKEMPQLIEFDELINLLPHKGKMFLLSRVTQHDTKKHTITSEYDITPDCIFYEEEADGVPTWAGFEFMAQGISALTGITNKMLGRLPLPGFILSVKDFKATVGYLKNGTTIQMKIYEDYREEETHVYNYICTLFAARDDQEPVVSAKITVMETEDIHALFKD